MCRWLQCSILLVYVEFIYSTGALAPDWTVVYGPRYPLSLPHNFSYPMGDCSLCDFLASLTSRSAEFLYIDDRKTYKRLHRFFDNISRCEPIIINPFIRAFWKELRKLLLYIVANMLPTCWERHFTTSLSKFITAIHCEIWMFNCATLRQVIQVKSDV